MDQLTSLFQIDHRDELGQFILTGSAVPERTFRYTRGNINYLKRCAFAI